MTYFYLKVAHVLAMSLFLGAGIASALTKIRADRTGDPRVILFAQNHIVLADWLFTVPSGIALPVTGFWMVHLLGLPWLGSWVGASLLLYATAGLAWLPAAYLQIKMRGAAAHAVETSTPLPDAYHRWNRIWFLLGIPAFVAAMLTVYVMVTKHVPWD